MELKKRNSDIVVGEVAVAPGEQKLLNIPIARLPTGTLIDIPIYAFNAKKPGPTILIQAGLHGDEINGIEIVRRMLQQKLFRIQRGAVIAVPILNVFGFIHFARDVPDGKDVNRSFPGFKSGSMASRIAYHYTKAILGQIDISIDLHTGGGQRANYPQVRYTREDPESEKLAQVFQAPFVFPSRLIRGSFRNAAFRLGIPTVVYEAGESMRFNTGAIEEGIHGILNILRHFDMIKSLPAPPSLRSKSIALTERKWLRAPMSGMFIPAVVNGSKVSKGQEMGLITDTYAKNQKKVRAPFSGYVICINNQAVISQGDALFHLGK